MGNLTGHTQGLSGTATSRTKKLLASVGRDEVLRLWDIGTQREVRSQNLGRRGTCLAFSPDDRTLVVGKIDGQIERWHVENWMKLASIEPIQAVSSIALSSDGRLLAAGNKQGTIWLWNYQDANAASSAKPVLLSSWNAHEGVVCDIAFNGDELASVGDDGKLIRWQQPATREVQHSFDLPGEKNLLASFSDRPLAVVASTAGVAVVDVRDGSLVTQLTKEHGDWQKVAVSRASNCIVASRWHGEVWVWREWSTGAKQPTIHRTPPEGSRTVLSADGSVIEVRASSADEHLVLVDLEIGQTLSQFPSKDCTAETISEDGRLLAVAERDTHIILVWDIEHREMLCELTGHRDSIDALVFSPDSRYLASLDDGANLVYWDVDIGRRVWTATSSISGASSDSQTSMSRSPSGRSIVATNCLGVVSIWHVGSGREMITLGETESHSTGLSFCDHGRYLCGIRENRLCVLETGVPGSRNKAD